LESILRSGRAGGQPYSGTAFEIRLFSLLACRMTGLVRDNCAHATLADFGNRASASSRTGIGFSERHAPALFLLACQKVVRQSGGNSRGSCAAAMVLAT